VTSEVSRPFRALCSAVIDLVTSSAWKSLSTPHVDRNTPGPLYVTSEDLFLV